MFLEENIMEKKENVKKQKTCYTEEELKLIVAENTTKENLRYLYDEPYVKKYRYIKHSKTKTHYDVIAEQLLKLEQNQGLENFFQDRIKTIKRKVRKNNNMIYLTESHNAQKEKEKALSHKKPLTEKWLAKSMLKNQYKYIGEIIDYEIPINEKDSDGAGKIDLLAYNRNTNSIFIIELKKENSTETILRAILEICTYYYQIDRDQLIKEYADPVFSDTKVKKVVLVFKGSLQHEQFNKSESIQKLAKKLNIDICLIDNDQIVKL